MLEPDDVPVLKTPEEVAGYLALKHANGMSFKDLLELHTLILTRIGRDHIQTWTQPEEYPETSSGYSTQLWLIQGGYFALSHLEDNDEWYT